MTYPNNQQGGYGQPAPGYGGQQGPPAPGGQGGYGPGPGYGGQQAPGYGPAPANYGPPQNGYGPGPGYGGQQAPPPPAADHTMAEYMDQPSTGSGRSVSGYFTQPGLWLSFTVARDVDRNDLREDTIPGTNQVRTFGDNRVRLVLVVPVIITGGNGPWQEHFSDGRGAIWLRGALRDEMWRAQREAGVQPDSNGRPVPPQAGAQGTLFFKNLQPVKGQGGQKLNDRKVLEVRYAQPAPGTAPVQAESYDAPQAYQAPQQAPMAAPAPPVAPQQAPVMQGPPAPMAPAAAPQQAPVMQGPPAPMAPAAVPQQAPVMQGPPAPGPVQGPPAPGPQQLPQSQEQLFAQLQGGAAQQPQG